MNGLMKMLMLSCKQAAMLNAKQALDSLSFGDAMKLKMHTKMCSTCKSLSEDTRFIDEAINKLFAERKEQKIALTDSQKKKIIDSIK